MRDRPGEGAQCSRGQGEDGTDVAWSRSGKGGCGVLAGRGDARLEAHAEQRSRVSEFAFRPPVTESLWKPEDMATTYAT